MYNDELEPYFQHFVGVDVGKETLVICHYGDHQTIEIPNTPHDIATFLSSYVCWLEKGYFVVDTTGGWERLLIKALLAAGACVHRADGRKVKSFARSLGRLAKTDALDAAILARYGRDRYKELFVCQAADESFLLLRSLITRRAQLAVYAKEEKQRLSGVLHDKMRALIESNLEQLQRQITQIEREIGLCIGDDPLLKRKDELMQTMPGIGPQTSALILAQLPELGQLDRKQAAAITGLAPHAYESGKMVGRRTTYGGRKIIKSALFLSALNCLRAKDNPFKAFYLKLVERGKSKRCALVAVARKLISVLNAKVRDAFYPQLKHMSR